MKIRKGFVSNSSSSSFVVVIPRNLDVDSTVNNTITELIESGELEPKYVSEKYLTLDGRISVDKIKKAVFECLSDGSIWHEYNRDIYYIIERMLSKYALASFETGPEGGEIVFLKQSQVEDMLKKFNEEI